MDQQARGKGAPLAADWVVGGGEMGSLIRAKRWADTPLGPIESWPQSLRSAVSILVPSKAQIILFPSRRAPGASSIRPCRRSGSCSSTTTATRPTA